MIYRTENNRVFVKITHSNNYKNNPNNKKVFFFDENRENLILQEKPYNKYKYDYIFSESENAMIISSTLNTFIYPLIEQEKNIIFLGIGQRGLNSSSFIFGNNSNALLGYDSLFYNIFKTIKEIMKIITYDKILLELYKIVDDKFVLDFKEIISDIDKILFLENINKHIKKMKIKEDAGDQSKSVKLNYSKKNNIEAKDGHMILKIKFFKFLGDNDLSKSQRQIEVIRTFSFIDIKDDEGHISNSVDNNPQSIYYFKKMIQSIVNYDLDKFTEISSNLTDILREIFSVPNLYSFIFGLINQYKDNLDKSLKTLNMLNICKNIDNDKFYLKLYQMNISISRIENKALKQDFQILNLIFGEIIYYLEKTFKKLDSYYIEVKDIELKEKFIYLKQWLIKNGYNFQKNQNFCVILENVLGYIKNRAQWMQLMKAKTMIVKLTEELKNLSYNNISINNNKYKIMRNNELYSINSRTYNKIMNDTFNNNTIKNRISSMDSEEKIFNDLDKIENNNKISNNINKKNKNKIKNDKKKNKNIIISKKDKSSSFGLSDLSCFDSKNNKNFLFNMNSRSIGEFPTETRSIEASFTQKLFKGLQTNFRHLFTDLYLRFTKEEEGGCFICRNDYPVNKNYKLNCQKWVNEYKSLSQLETGINMDKISMIYKGKNKNNNNESSYYDKDEEIKIHFYDDENSIKNNKKISKTPNNDNDSNLSKKPDNYSNFKKNNKN